MIRHAFHVRIENKSQADGAQEQSLGIYHAAKLHQLQIAVGRYLAFTSGGTRELVPGIILTGAISGATARLGAVTVGTGSWEAGTAAGDLVLYDQVGTFVSETLNWGLHTNVATITSDSSAPSAGTLTIGVKSPEALDFVDLTHTIDLVNGPFLYQIWGMVKDLRFTPTSFTAVNLYTIDINSGDAEG